MQGINNIVLCYHGCVRSSSESLTFRENVEDIKSHLSRLLELGYEIVFPATIHQYVIGNLQPTKPLVAVHFDDGLSSILLITDWLISQKIKFSIAIIGARQKTFQPEGDYLSWEDVKGLVSSGYCEIASHTYDMHHLVHRQLDGLTGPVMDGPFFQDNGQFTLEPDVPITDFWRNDLASKGGLAFPMFGSDPGKALLDSNKNIIAEGAPITSAIMFKAIRSFNLHYIRYWAGLSRPYGAGYNVNLEVYLDGVLVSSPTMAPKNYETRSQWAEREYVSIPITSAPSIVAGQQYTITIKTLNSGRGISTCIAVPYTLNQDVQCVSDVVGLTYGSKNMYEVDYQAGQVWDARPIVILADNTGANITTAQWDSIVNADLAKNTAMINDRVGTDWNYVWPVLYSYYSDAASAFSTKIAGSALKLATYATVPVQGTTGTQTTKDFANNPPPDTSAYEYVSIIGTTPSPAGVPTPVYSKIMYTATRDFIGTALTIPVGGSNGNWYTTTFSLSVSTAMDDTQPWTKLSSSNLLDWRLSVRKPPNNNLVIDFDTPYQFTANTVYWFRVDTNSAYTPYDVLEKLHLTYMSVLYANFTNYLLYTGTKTQLQAKLVSEHNIPTDQKPIGTIRLGLEGVVNNPKAFTSADTKFTTITHLGVTTTVLNWSNTTWTSPYFGTVSYYSNANNYRDYPVQSITFTPTAGLTSYNYYKNSVNDFGGWGDPKITVVEETANTLTTPIEGLVYPFGSYTSSISTVTDLQNVEDVSPDLKTILDNNNLFHAYTIWPGSVRVEGGNNEPGTRQTRHTIPRWLVYGDQSLAVSKGTLDALTGAPWGRVGHLGCKWQVSVEPTTYYKGSSAIATNIDYLDYIAFDAYFFRPDGTILKSQVMDGGYYLDVTGTSSVGTFQAGETITGSVSLATANIVWATNDPNYNIIKVNPVSGTLTGGETITGAISNATAILDQYGAVKYYDNKSECQAKGVITTIIISNYDYVISDVNPVVSSYVLANPNVFITEIVNILNTENWDGITLNLESVDPLDRLAATNFVKALSVALKANNKVFHITSPAKTGTAYDSPAWLGWCDHAEIAKYVDVIKIMSYTESGDWSPPRPHAPKWFWEAVYTYVARNIPVKYRRRVVVGANSHSDVWKNGSSVGYGYSTFSNALAGAIFLGAEIVPNKDDSSEAYFRTHNNIEGYLGTAKTTGRALHQSFNMGIQGPAIWKADDGDNTTFLPTKRELRYNNRRGNGYLGYDLLRSISNGITVELKVDVSKVNMELVSNITYRSARQVIKIIGSRLSSEVLDFFISIAPLLYGKNKGNSVVLLKNPVDYKSTTTLNANSEYRNYRLVGNMMDASSDIVLDTNDVLAKVYVNGVIQQEGTDYTIGAYAGLNNLISFIKPLANTDILKFDYEFYTAYKVDVSRMSAVMDIPSFTKFIKANGIVLNQVLKYETYNFKL